MNRLLIVDGSNLLFQMFFGMPARIVNEQGKAIQTMKIRTTAIRISMIPTSTRPTSIQNRRVKKKKFLPCFANRK